MKHQLVLHIGTHKTGTSAIQQFFWDNAVQIKKYGWCYPNLKKEGLQTWGSEIRNGYCFYKEQRYFNENDEEWLKRVWDYLYVCLENYNVLLSAEEIWTTSTKKIVEMLKNKYDNIKIVVYLRRQDYYVESMWNQMIKRGPFYDREFEKYIESINKKNVYLNEINYEDVIKEYNCKMEKSSFYEELCYLDKLEQISKIIGKENLIIRTYEKERFVGNNDLLNDFMCAIGLCPDWTELVSTKQENESLKGNYVDIKRVINSVLHKGYDSYKWDISDKIVEICDLFVTSHKKEGYFSNEERKIFLEKFQKQNEIIARDYLGRENGILFYDKQIEYEKWESKITSFEEDLIRTFIVLYFQNCEQQKRIEWQIQQLEKKNQLLAENIWVMQAKNRKFAFFGAGERCKKLLESFSICVEIIFDNDAKKNGTRIFGVQVMLAEKVLDWKKYFVVVTCNETLEIELQLQTLGLKKGEDYILAKDFLYVKEV